MDGTIERRVFITGVGGAAGAAWISVGPLNLFGIGEAGAVVPTGFRLVRADDQMVVDVDMFDIDIVDGNIVPVGGAGVIRLTFGSQHTAEAALNGTAGTPTALPLAFGHRVAGPSRVAFSVTNAIPFTIDSLLNLSQHQLVLDPRATNMNGAPPSSAPPADDVTSIELPYDLKISPHQFARFDTDAQPQTVEDVTEIFRLRLGRLNGGVFTEQPTQQPWGRALHTDGSGDPAGPTIDTEYLPSTDDRADLVELLAGTERFFSIDKLWLSTAGGAFSTSAAFPAPRPVGNDLLAWNHRVVTGRDTFVQIVTAGYVLPWGLPAAVIEQTERRFIGTEAADELTAAMVFERYLVTSPEAVNPNSGNGAPNGGNALPFDEMRLGAIEQRPIGTIPFDAANPDDAFWITEGSTGNAVSLPLTVTDKAGHEHSVAMPVAFVTASVADQAGGIADIISHYNAQTGAPPGNVREVDFGGRRVGWTVPRTTDEGTISTERMQMQVEARLPDGGVGLPSFAPVVERAWIVDDTVAGAAGKTQPAAEVVIPDIWKDFADSASNAAGAFLEYVNPLDLSDFAGEAGGLGSPGFSLSTLSLAFGSGPNLFGGGGGGLQWDPSTALSGAKILGFLDLADLVSLVTLPSGGILNGFDLPQIPRFNIEIPDVPEIPEEVCYRFHWEPEDPETKGVYLAGSDAPEVTGDPSILIDILSCVSPLELDAYQTIEVDIRNFGIAVPPAPFVRAIELGFNRVAYCKLPGQEATTDIDFAGLKFVGALGFLEPVKQFFEDLSDNFTVIPSPSGVFAEAKIPIPPIELGVLGLRNLEGIAAVDVSFDGSPVVMNASLGRKVDPFEVRVLAAGGIGWLELDASTENGVERLSAGFAVTYTAGIDLVVAEVSITGSIGGGIEVENGEVTVLVIIAVEGVASAFGLSVGFCAELELQYNASAEILRGIARVTVGFYSKLVNLEKTFEIEEEIVLGDGTPPSDQQLGGGGSSPPAALAMVSGASDFSSQYSSSAWTEYCGSFA